MSRIGIARRALFVALLVPAASQAIGFYTIAPVAFYPPYIINSTGDWGLRFLVLTLWVTPVRRLTGWHDIIQLRRPLGLAAFFYSSVHVALWALFDWSFDLHKIIERIVTDAFSAVGAAAFVLLIPLALTSNRWSMSGLGRRWQKVHWLTYVATAATLAHFWLRGPYEAQLSIKWIVIVVFLLGFRWWLWRRSSQRSR